MEQVKHLVIADTKGGLAVTMYAGFNENRANYEIKRLLGLGENVTRILYRQGKAKYQVLKG